MLFLWRFINGTILLVQNLLHNCLAERKKSELESFRHVIVDNQCSLKDDSALYIQKYNIERDRRFIYKSINLQNDSTDERKVLQWAHKNDPSFSCFCCMVTGNLSTQKCLYGIKMRVSIISKCLLIVVIANKQMNLKQYFVYYTNIFCCHQDEKLVQRTQLY